MAYRRTLFKNTETGTSCYLLDQLMGLEKHERLTEDAIARVFEEAAESSYRKGGMNASISGCGITKAAVMGKLHALTFPPMPVPEEKKAAEKLYIDADEDHVALQYLFEKGDIRKPRNNTAMPYIVYVYEGVADGAGGKPRLISPAYFGGLYEGAEGVRRLWDEVYAYIEGAYDMDTLERIYITGDGAEEARNEICRAVHKKVKWMAGLLRSMTGTDKKTGCSAEGHVSHVYSDRMSSRPSGWCRTGADRMAGLRIYRQNGRDMLELARYQKKELPVAAGAEEVTCTATQMLRAEKRNRERLGELADMPVYSVPYPQVKKIAALKNHIWGL